MTALAVVWSHGTSVHGQHSGKSVMSTTGCVIPPIAQIGRVLYITALRLTEALVIKLNDDFCLAAIEKAWRTPTSA